MTSTNDDFLEISRAIHERLLDQGEIAFRTIINRSYYGLLHKLKNKFETDFGITSFNLPSIHQDLINYTKRYYGQKYSKTLENFRRYRTNADYYLNYEFTSDDARNIIFKIEDFIDQLKL